MDRTQPVFVIEADLAPADVLFCVGDKTDLAWAAITYGSSGDYVHAAVYVGDGYVVEATTAGVKKTKLAEFIARYSYVAACRCPGVKPGGVPDLGRKVVNYCLDHAALKTPYNMAGALKSPVLEYNRLRFQNNSYLPYIKPIKSKPTASFFCSEMVVEAFIYGGYIKKGEMDACGYSPVALAEDGFLSLIGYLGSSDMRQKILENDYFLTGGIPLSARRNTRP